MLDGGDVFWILAAIHLGGGVVVAVFDILLKSIFKCSSLIAFAGAMLLTAALLFLFFIIMLNFTSSGGRGMGNIILLLYPLIEALMAGMGGIALLVWCFKKLKKVG